MISYPGVDDPERSYSLTPPERRCLNGEHGRIGLQVLKFLRRLQDRPVFLERLYRRAGAIMEPVERVSEAFKALYCGPILIFSRDPEETGGIPLWFATLLPSDQQTIRWRHRVSILDLDMRPRGSDPHPFVCSVN